MIGVTGFGSSRQGCNSAGESPAAPVARLGHEAMEEEMECGGQSADIRMIHRRSLSPCVAFPGGVSRFCVGIFL
jgi:hypothetical protein